MRILMTTSRNQNLLAPAYFRYFQNREGVEVEGIFHPDAFDDFYHASIVNKVLFRLYPPSCLNKINKGIRKQIETFKPDVLWIFKGMEIYPETLEFAKREGVRLVNYNPDHPFDFEFRGSGNKYVRESMPLYDLHLSYSKSILQQLKQHFGHEGAWLPFGFALDNGQYEQLDKNHEQKRICFVGYADETRAAAVKELAKAGLNVDVYGPGWSNLLETDDRLQIHEPVQGMQFWNTLRRYRIQLNVFRKQNAGSHNMRSFEIPAAGGLMLAPHSVEHAEFFDEGSDAFFYSSPADMVEKAKLMLNLGQAEADKLRENARNRSTNSGYSYANRAEYVLNVFRTKFPELKDKLN